MTDITRPRLATSELINAYVADVLDPVRTRPSTTARRVLQTRKVTAVVGAVATLVQLVIWLLIVVGSGHLDSPWWLITAVPVALAVGALTLIEHPLRHPVDR